MADFLRIPRSLFWPKFSHLWLTGRQSASSRWGYILRCVWGDGHGNLAKISKVHASGLDVQCCKCDLDLDRYLYNRHIRYPSTTSSGHPVEDVMHMMLCEVKAMSKGKVKGRAPESHPWWWMSTLGFDPKSHPKCLSLARTSLWMMPVYEENCWSFILS